MRGARIQRVDGETADRAKPNAAGRSIALRLNTLLLYWVTAEVLIEIIRVKSDVSIALLHYLMHPPCLSVRR